MRSAIYYPHTTPVSSDILRTALLLWDELEFIVPWEGFVPDHSDRDVAEIVELIGRQSVPSHQAKRLAHERIEEFATQQLPASFRYGAGSETDLDAPYMFARKLLPETWEMLRELQLAGSTDGRANALRDNTGLVLMSILTDCCAGEGKARITDRSDAYANLSSFLVRDDAPSADDETLQQCVVPVTMGVINADRVPLRDLIAFRQREARSSGDDLRRMRQRYRTRIEHQIEALAATTLASDRRELQRAFEVDMRDDLADLKEELRLARTGAFTSKDLIFLAVTALTAGVAAAKGLHIPVEQVTAGGSLPILGGVLNSRSKYAEARRSIIAKHPMAYMLELDARVCPFPGRLGRRR